MDFFFFQAEDGIRDKLVTGVQTCALPILPADRFQTAAQFVDALARPGWALTTTAPDVAAPALGRLGRRAVRDVAPWAVAGLAIGIALWTAWVHSRPELRTPPVARVTLALPAGA